jgi:hypothetical protein
VTHACLRVRDELLGVRGHRYSFTSVPIGSPRATRLRLPWRFRS